MPELSAPSGAQLIRLVCRALTWSGLLALTGACFAYASGSGVPNSNAGATWVLAVLGLCQLVAAVICWWPIRELPREVSDVERDDWADQ